jgi:hypothetical protein
MNLSDLSDQDLYTTKAKCQLEMQKMASWTPRMDEVQNLQNEVENEIRRRHSIFNGSFRGGV